MLIMLGLKARSLEILASRKDFYKLAAGIFKLPFFFLVIIFNNVMLPLRNANL